MTTIIGVSFLMTEASLDSSAILSAKPKLCNSWGYRLSSREFVKINTKAAMEITKSLFL